MSGLVRAWINGVGFSLWLAGCASSPELRCAAAPPASALPDPEARYVAIRETAFDQSCRAVCDQILVRGEGSSAEIEALIETIAHVDEAPVLSIEFGARAANQKRVRAVKITTGVQCTGTSGAGAKYDLEYQKSGWRITSAASWSGS